MEEIDELGPTTVFTIKESEIPKGITQCVKHTWRKLSEDEVECTKCPTACHIDHNQMNSYLCQE